jgi:hypothetical protein
MAKKGPDSGNQEDPRVRKAEYLLMIHQSAMTIAII